jgi:hypothetical protein
MALEVSVNEIESAAVGGPGSEGMKALIAKMGEALRTFPSNPDESDLTRAFQAFIGHKDAEFFKGIGIGISARTFAKSTAKLLDAMDTNRRIAKRKVREAAQLASQAQAATEGAQRQQAGAVQYHV